MRYILVCNGSNDFKKEHLQENDVLVAVDGGLNNLKVFKLIPDIFVGDLDSYSDIIEEIKEKHVLNKIKDKSDLEVALLLILERIKEEDEIIIHNALGKRLDHLLANLRLVIKYQNFNITIVDNNNCFYILKKSQYINNNYNYISFFNIDLDTVISLTGFKYPLSNYQFRPLDNTCLSNEGSGEVQINKSIIVIHSNDLS